MQRDERNSMRKDAGYVCPKCGHIRVPSRCDDCGEWIAWTPEKGKYCPRCNKEIRYGTCERCGFHWKF